MPVKAVRWDPARRGDPYAYYAELRRHAPVLRAKIPTRGTGWVVSRYEDVLRVLKDPSFSNDERNSASPPLFGFGGRFAPRLIRLVGDSMVCVDDPAHRAAAAAGVQGVHAPVDRRHDALGVGDGRVDARRRRGTGSRRPDGRLRAAAPAQGDLGNARRAGRAAAGVPSPGRAAARGQRPARPAGDPLATRDAQAAALLRGPHRPQAPGARRPADQPADRRGGGGRPPQPRRAHRHDVPPPVRGPRDVGEPHRQRPARADGPPRSDGARAWPIRA